MVVKLNLDKLLTIGFTTPKEEAFPNSCSIEKKWEVLDLHGFVKVECHYQKDLYPLPFTKQVLNMVASHEVDSFLDGFCNYHKILIALKDRYKTTFITNWRTFVQIIMPFGLNNTPSMYQHAISLAFWKYLGVFMKLF